MRTSGTGEESGALLSLSLMFEIVFNKNIFKICSSICSYLASPLFPSSCVTEPSFCFYNPLCSVNLLCHGHPMSSHQCQPSKWQSEVRASLLTGFWKRFPSTKKKQRGRHGPSSAAKSHYICIWQQEPQQSCCDHKGVSQDKTDSPRAVEKKDQSYPGPWGCHWATK